MKDCLLKTLKGSVTDNDLKPFGKIRVRVKKLTPVPTSNYNVLQVQFNEETTLELVGDSQFYSTYPNNQSAVAQGKTKTISANTLTNVFIGNGDCFIDIPKYTLIYFGTSSAAISKAFSFDLADFEYAGALSKFKFGQIGNLPILQTDLADIEGTILILPLSVDEIQGGEWQKTNVDINDVVSHLTALTKINWNGYNMVGNIDTIARMIDIVDLFKAPNLVGTYNGLISKTKLAEKSAMAIGRAKIVGNLEDLLEEWYSHNTSGSFTQTYIEGILFNNVDIKILAVFSSAATINIGLVKNGSTLSVYGGSLDSSGTKIAEYNGSSWTYLYT